MNRDYLAGRESGGRAAALGDRMRNILATVGAMVRASTVPVISLA